MSVPYFSLFIARIDGDCGNLPGSPCSSPSLALLLQLFILYNAVQIVSSIGCEKHSFVMMCWQRE